MSKQIYKNEEITAYLLGSLPEAEAERLDELSFIDDEFADALRAAEKDLVDAYVQGELSGTPLERFRSYYLTSPLRREKVKFAQAFQSMAEKNAATPAVEVQAERPGKLPARRRARGWPFNSRVVLTPRPVWTWGLAAAVLALLITGGWLASENMRLRREVARAQAGREELGRRQQELQRELSEQRSTGSQTEQELARARDEREHLERELKNEQAQAQQRIVEGMRAVRPPPPPRELSIASFILTPQMRDAGQMPTVSIPPGTDYAAMRLELGAFDYPAYRVVLLDRSRTQSLWRSGQLRARATGEGFALTLRLLASLFKPQAYVLQVSGVPANGAPEIVGDYPFKIVK